MTTSSFLAKMVAASRERAAAVRGTAVDRRPDPAPAAGRLEAALRHRPPAGGGWTGAGSGGSGRLAVIAEVKRASPSRGPIAPDLDAARQARAYEEAGAAAVSVLTEPSRFGGSLDDLLAAAAAVRIPVLRKDFLVDPCQVREAATCGAAAVLLIAAALDAAALAGMLTECAACGLDALVECHDETEVGRATAAGARIIGVNNRDLVTLHVDLATTERLAHLVPEESVLVAESGVHSAGDAARMQRAGAHAVLIGEALVRSAPAELATAIAAFSGSARTLAGDASAKGHAAAAPTRIKICGLTRAGDVGAAARLGAWACGFVLTGSPRRVSTEQARRLAAEAEALGVLTVGVFATESAEEIAAAATTAGLGAVQLSAGRDGPSVAAVRDALTEAVDGEARTTATGSASGRDTRSGRYLLIAAADAPGAADADFVLYDSRSPGVYGGTGRTLDWAAVAAAVGEPSGTRPVSRGGRVVLAGGLTPRNVAGACRTVRPFAVDVSGGVESRPGVKDHDLLAAFFAAVETAASASAGSAPASDRRPLHPDDRELHHDR